MWCQHCGGTVLAPAVGGPERGSCHCPKGPGHIIAHLYYGTRPMPGGVAREYEVEFLGQITKPDPPTLANALVLLNTMRTRWIAEQAGVQLPP